MNPLVSIITPYRNAEPFLAEAIASVREQTFDQWELMLIDDGSSDASRKIAEGAAASDHRIRSLAMPSHSSPGAAAARNWGLEHSIGEFITFLDADDRFMLDKLATELELMRLSPTAGMTCGGTIWWHPGHEYRNWSDEIRSVRPGLYPGAFLLNRAMLLQRAPVPCLCGVMVRRDVLPAAPAFETTLSLYEDQSFLAKIVAQCPVYIGRHLTAFYRQHSSSTSSGAAEVGHYDRMRPHRARSEFLAWFRHYIESKPELLATSGEALLFAEAIQSGHYRALDSRQRAQIIAWTIADIAKRPPRRTVQWLKRRALQFRLRGPGV